MQKWKCTVCGYIHSGDEPPDVCPVCGADRSKFVPIEDAPERLHEQASRPSAPQEPPAKQAPPPNVPPPEAGWKRFAASRFGQKLTQYHGHPIAVHIPNGVLPLAVLFALLSALFDSESLAIAAQYNIGFVAISMPVVIGTGIVDWINSYKGRMTRIFRVKMICAAIVSVISLVLMIWGFVQPQIYHRHLIETWAFLLLHLGNLVAATIAGWYGGKLVFRK